MSNGRMAWRGVNNLIWRTIYITKPNYLSLSMAAFKLRSIVQGVMEVAMRYGEGEGGMDDGLKIECRCGNREKAGL